MKKLIESIWGSILKKINIYNIQEAVPESICCLNQNVASNVIADMRMSQCKEQKTKVKGSHNFSSPKK
jgi:hypothetical protein